MVFDGLMIAVQLGLIYLAVDLVAGFFHWAEDTLGRATSPVWGPLFVAPNVTHHDHPQQMLRIHWFINSLPLYGLGLVILGGAWALDALGWQVWAFVGFGIFSQQAHRWSHTPRKVLPRPVLWAQRMGILQNGPMHWRHHRGDHATHFCPVTPWMNPLVDRIGLWRGLERVMVPIFGAPRRPDLARYTWYRDRAFWAAVP